MQSAHSQLRKKPKNLKRSSRNEKSNNGSEGQPSDVVESHRVRKKTKRTASPKKSGDTRENSERKVRGTQEDLSDFPCAERSEQPTTDIWNSPRVEPSEQPKTDQKNPPCTERSEQPTTDQRNPPGTGRSEQPTTYQRSTLRIEL